MLPTRQSPLQDGRSASRRTSLPEFRSVTRRLGLSSSDVTPRLTTQRPSVSGRLSVVSRILAIYPIAVACLLLALPLLAPRSGPLVLANIFSIHLALAGLLLVPVAIAIRGRPLAIGLALLVVVSVARFGGDWVSAPFSRDSSDGLYSAASWNLELGARSGSDAVGDLKTIDVDLIALQELGPDHARAIEASETLTSTYPHRALYPDPGVLGMGLLS